ncbi:MAG TPA: cobalamin B12-binding domain-containing protein [Coriobacteriia bacterium]|nr:cobalamin B12-binding domain-containing protein [Coriobacteriia bacterium]
MQTHITSSENISNLRERLNAAAASRDRAAFVAVAVEATRAGEVTVPELYTCVLGPLLADIGSAWQHGQERVWEEHYASAAVRTIVEMLYLDVAKAAESVPKRGEKAVLACPPDERHDLGLRMLADRMMLVGWDVYFLGQSTPNAEIIAAAKALSADLVVLTVATHFNRVELRATIERITRELPGVRVGVGGPAFGYVEDWPAEEILTEAMIGLDRDSECGA